MSKISRNFTVDDEIYKKARIMRLNMSQAAEAGLRQELAWMGGDIKSMDELLIEAEIEAKKRIIAQAEKDATNCLEKQKKAEARERRETERRAEKMRKEDARALKESHRLIPIKRFENTPAITYKEQQRIEWEKRKHEINGTK